METILLTEDDVALRAQMRFALEERFEVLEAGDVRKSVNLLNKHNITMAILDLGLPPNENTPDEGLRLLHYILENFDIKVIILTGQKTESAALEAIKSGAFDYIVKPASMEKIFFSIDRAILFRDTERKIEQLGTKKITFDIEVGKGLQPAREEAEKNIILKVLKDTNFNVYKSAKLLGVKRESLYYFIKKFGFKREDIDDDA
ncbi:MAG TPA: response regulator [Syntrophorhabdaceae bacterium]|nr:response regulator [Syntrophorhabdaceae bacterium]